MPAVDSKIVTVARAVLTTPLASTIPPTPASDRDLSSRGPCQHRTFKQAQTTQQTQSIKKTIWHWNWQVWLRRGVRTRHPPLAPAFGSWPPASHQQIAHEMGHPPEAGLTELPPPLGLESPARPGFGLRPNPGESLRACFCEYGWIYISYLQRIYL